jgi:hypothetical protein
MEDLIARLKAAQEGSRELDVEIERAEWRRRHGDRPMPKDLLISIPKYTRSIDAALTLLPREWLIFEMTQWEGDSGDWWEFQLVQRGRSLDETEWIEPDRGNHTPALALCVAALMALAADTSSAANSTRRHDP